MAGYWACYLASVLGTELGAGLENALGSKLRIALGGELGVPDTEIPDRGLRALICVPVGNGRLWQNAASDYHSKIHSCSSP